MPSDQLRAEVDIHQKIELALRKSEERFRRVVEYAPNAMIMVNAAGVIEMVNAQAEALFGYQRGELVGRSIDALVPARLRGPHAAHRSAFLGDPRSRPMGAGRDLYALRKDGSEFPVEIGLNPIETEDGVMVLSAIIDISDRKQREEHLQRALREKDILLSEVHHRVKNNLQIVYSLLDLHALRVTDPLTLEMLRDSQARIRTMAVIHRTLYQSKDFSGVDFRDFLDSLVPNLIGTYSANPELITVQVEADIVRLPIDVAVPCGLVVNELISNALKHAFGSGQGGEIRVDVHAIAGERAALVVADNGRGIPASIDLEAPTTLGLQLVTLLADQLGGTLDIHRADPTRVAIEFPVPG